MYTVYLWLLAAGTTLLAEIGHPGLFLSLSFSLGSLAAAGIAYYDAAFTTQLLGFIGISIGTFSFLRSAVRTYSHAHATNTHALIGATGIITERITPSIPGRVKINGEEWRAKTMDTTSLEPGSHVHVIRIDRTTAIVSPYHTHS